VTFSLWPVPRLAGSQDGRACIHSRPSEGSFTSLLPPISSQNKHISAGSTQKEQCSHYVKPSPSVGGHPPQKYTRVSYQLQTETHLAVKLERFSNTAHCYFHSHASFPLNWAVDEPCAQHNVGSSGHSRAALRNKDS
jgi:hypothetical protein